jgi:hypothetical protein
MTHLSSFHSPLCYSYEYLILAHLCLCNSLSSSQKLHPEDRTSRFDAYSYQRGMISKGEPYQKYNSSWDGLLSGVGTCSFGSDTNIDGMIDEYIRTRRSSMASEPMGTFFNKASSKVDEDKDIE